LLPLHRLDSTSFLTITITTTTMTATTAATPADNKKHIQVVEKKNDDIIDIDDDVEDIFNLSVGGIFRGT
jgi:hypothetical protein